MENYLARHTQAYASTALVKWPGAPADPKAQANTACPPTLPAHQHISRPLYNPTPITEGPSTAWQRSQQVRYAQIFPGLYRRPRTGRPAMIIACHRKGPIGSDLELIRYWVPRPDPLGANNGPCSFAFEYRDSHLDTHHSLMARALCADFHDSKQPATLGDAEPNVGALQGWLNSLCVSPVVAANRHHGLYQMPGQIRLWSAPISRDTDAYVSIEIPGSYYCRLLRGLAVVVLRQDEHGDWRPTIHLRSWNSMRRLQPYIETFLQREHGSSPRLGLFKGKIYIFSDNWPMLQDILAHSSAGEVFDHHETASPTCSFAELEWEAQEQTRGRRGRLYAPYRLQLYDRTTAENVRVPTYQLLGHTIYEMQQAERRRVAYTPAPTPASYSHKATAREYEASRSHNGSSTEYSSYDSES